MTTQTKNLNLSIFDFATDSTANFVNGVAGLTDSNMHKIDEAIANLEARLAQLEKAIALSNQEQSSE